MTRSHFVSTVLAAFLALTATPGVVLGQPGDAPEASAAETKFPFDSTWTATGGPPGGLGYDVRIDPTNPDVMYVTASPGGIFKSIDGGATWTSITKGIESRADAGAWIFCATIDPHSSSTIWVGTQFTGQLYRSIDSGTTWKELEIGLDSTTVLPSFRGITVDPKDPSTVYAAMEKTVEDGQSGGEVWKSTDGGESWKKIWDGDNLARYVWIDPTNTKRLYVSTGIFDFLARGAKLGTGNWEDMKGVGILRSDDAGATWTVLGASNGLGGLYVPSLYMHPDDPKTLLAAVTGQRGRAKTAGPFVTRDGGDTWTQVFAASTAEAVEISETDPDVWYVATNRVIYRSDDAGTNWKEYSITGSGRPAGIPIDLQADPRDPLRIFSNEYSGGNIMSDDGGVTWKDASRGYTGAGVTHVEVSNGGRTLFADTMIDFRSTDGGATWSASDSKFVHRYKGANGTELLIGATAKEGVNPGVANFSSDGGATWTSSTIADFDQLLRDGIVDEISCTACNYAGFAVSASDPSTMYAIFPHKDCVESDWTSCLTRKRPGVYKSTDGGTTWAAVTAPFLLPIRIVVSPADARVLFVSTMSGPYRTRDGGTTWEKLQALDTAAAPGAGNPAPSIYSFAVDPFDSNRVLAGSTLRGAFLSSDGGSTWSESTTGTDAAEMFRAFVFDPTQSGLVYGATVRSGVYVSTDGGLQWTKHNTGLGPLTIAALAIDSSGTVLYAGTQGRGVYRLGTVKGPPRRRTVRR